MNDEMTGFNYYKWNIFLVDVARTPYVECTINESTAN